MTPDVTPSEGENSLSDDYLLEQAYLVERGVRSVALVGTTHGGLQAAREIATRLKCLASDVITFVIPGAVEGNFTYGYASHAWAVSLLQWALSDDCPQRQANQIIGLMLGYSADAIRTFDERGSGQTAIWSPLPESSSQPSCTSDNQGTRD